MSEDGTREGIGVRLARARKRRGLTQHGLAQRSNYSRSHVAQVEAGHKVATPAFIAAAAAAMSVDPADLYGQPFRSFGRDDQVHAVIPELRRVLVYVDVGPDLTGAPRTLDQLAAEVSTAHRLLLQAQLNKLGTRLPSVIEELTYHAYESDVPRAWLLLNRAHYAAASLARRLGYGGDALALLDRAAEAGRRSGHPHLPLLVTRLRTLMMMGMTQYRPALTVLSHAAEQVHTDLPDAGEVAGSLNLRAAVVAARAGEKTEAWDHWHRAAELIDASRAGAEMWGSQFNAANVAIHGAAVAVELGDLDEAARRDHQISERTLTGVVPERRAHHEIDMARVHVETGDYGKALERLLSAEKTAPQMTHYHPSARSVVAHLVDVRRTLPEPLRGLHTRMSA